MLGGKNLDNIKIYGSEDSAVFFAFKGATGLVLPQSLDDEIPDAFHDVGWISDSGVEIGVNVESGEIKAWQGGTSVAFPVTGSSKTYGFTAMEDTPLVARMFYGASEPVAAGSGAARVNLPGAIGSVEGAAIVKAVANDVVKYYVQPLVSITDRSNVAHTSSDPSTHQMTLAARGDGYIITNHPAYVAAVQAVTPG